MPEGDDIKTYSVTITSKQFALAMGIVMAVAAVYGLILWKPAPEWLLPCLIALYAVEHLWIGLRKDQP